MKKLFFIVISISLFFIACKHKDTQDPMIFLNGDNPMTVTLNSWWEDPGVTVDDNVDGSSLTNAVEVTHNIEIDGAPNGEGPTKLTGEYVVTYTVSDKAGNSATVTRQVIVKNSAEIYATKYDIDINSDNEQIVHDSTIVADATFDTRTNHVVWFPKLGGKINRKTFNNTIRASAYFSNKIDTATNKVLIYIPLQRFVNYEGATAADTTVKYIYSVRGVNNMSYIIDTISPRFTIKYSIDKYRKATNGLLDTLGDKWEIFRQDIVVENWLSY